MSELLIQYPLLLLFVVAALGYLISNIRYKNSTVGVAAILFTGLAFGAFDARFTLPEIILYLGLSIYVYSLGLSSGPAFFNSFRKNGPRDLIFITGVMVLTGVTAGLIMVLFEFSSAIISGLFSGSGTSSAALAGVIDYIASTYQGDEAKNLTESAVVGFTWSYPMGVIGGMIAIYFFEKVWKINYRQEEKDLRFEYPVDEGLTSATIKITRKEVINIQCRDLFKKYNWNVTAGRIIRNDEIKLFTWDIELQIGDLIMLVGSHEELEKAVNDLGIRARSLYTHDRSRFDVRRIFVSNPKIAGRTIASLNIDQKFDTVITRIRRGDIDMLAKPTTVLELGDRIRFIARREDLKALSKYFGDSYSASSKVDLFTFGLGIALGLILGSIEFNLGPNLSFKLGYAGGPLLVGLFLGYIRRTGPFVWSLPYSANMTLQQIGLILLLATIGVRSGHAFSDSFSIQAVYIFLASVGLSLTTAAAILIIGYKLMKLPFSLLIGMVANQPAILEYATQRSKSKIPEFGYALAFPFALISKILIAQLLILLL